MSLFARQINQAHSSDSPIAPHPSLTSFRSMRIAFLLLLAFMIFLFIFEPLTDIVARNIVHFSWEELPVLLIYLGIVGFAFIMERRLKHFEVLRMAAAQDDDSLLADEQPEPNAEALRVPVKFTMRFSRKGLLAYGSSLGLLFLILANASFLFEQWLQHMFDPSIWWWVLVLTVAAIALMAFVFTVIWRQRRIIEVSQEGIRSWTKSLGMNERGAIGIFWHEARLFACYRKPGPWNKRAALVYELSSSNRVIQWTWVQQNKSLRIGEEPTIPFEEYQAQMRALCSLIVAKTGLPLYDLSSERAIKRAKAIKDEKPSRE
jgi:hypothetical protein